MSDYYQESKTDFLKNVADFQMNVRHDDGVFRNLVFSQGESFVHRFEITTWPGYLAITGDMGAYVFTRHNDMFEFFRGDWINPRYWAEKLVSVSFRNGLEEFDLKRFIDVVTNEFDAMDFDSEEDKSISWQSITDEWDGLFTNVENDCAGVDVGTAQSYAIMAAENWRCPVTKRRLSNFLEHDFRTYTYHFLWCCQAIQWAIKIYDESRSAPALKAS